MKNFKIDDLKNKRILALIGIVCLTAGTFLPYLKVSVWTYNYTLTLWNYWEGKVIIALTLASTLFIFRDWVEKYAPQLFNNNIGKLVDKYNNTKYSLVPTILIALLALYLLSDIDVSSKYLNYGIGFWIIWIGIISLVGHAVLYKKQNIQSVQNNINSVPNIETNQPNQDNTGIKYCPNCGTKLNENADTCFGCGNKF